MSHVENQLDAIRIGLQSAFENTETDLDDAHSRVNDLQTRVTTLETAGLPQSGLARLEEAESLIAELMMRVAELEGGSPPPPPPPIPTFDVKDTWLKFAWSRTGPYNGILGPPYAKNFAVNRNGPINWSWSQGADQGDNTSGKQKATDPSIAGKLVNCWLVISQSAGYPVITDQVAVETRHPLMYRRINGAWQLSQPYLEWNQYSEAGMLPGSTPGGNTTGFLSGERVPTTERGGQSMSCRALARTNLETLHTWFNGRGKVLVGSGCSGIAFACQVKLTGSNAHLATYHGYAGQDLWVNNATIQGSLGEGANVKLTEDWQWVCVIDGSMTIARLDAGEYPPLPVIGSPADT